MAAELCYYHWRELPQVPFLSRQKFCHVTKLLCCLSPQNVCRDKYLSQQTKFCRNKYLPQQTILSRQNDKHTFVATNTCSVATKVCFILLAAPASDSILLSREKIQSKLVATKQCLSRQKCREKYTFIATKKPVAIKIILVAAHANDRLWLCFRLNKKNNMSQRNLTS